MIQPNLSKKCIFPQNVLCQLGHLFNVLWKSRAHIHTRALAHAHAHPLARPLARTRTNARTRAHTQSPRHTCTHAHITSHHIPHPPTHTHCISFCVAACRRTIGKHSLWLESCCALHMLIPDPSYSFFSATQRG